MHSARWRASWKATENGTDKGNTDQHGGAQSAAGREIQTMKSIKVGLLGVGNVGGGTFDVLRRNQEEIRRRAGRGIEIVAVSARNLERAGQRTAGQCKVVSDPFAIVNDPEIDIVVELIGGYDTAKELVMQAIANGKHVVTANKALLALHGTEIFAAAHAKGVMVAFEAAVAGGIPIIKALREGLTANRIEWIAGIINGTTNFILSEMRDKGLDFNTVLAEAQRLGYAEADPTFDIEGVDAAHKVTIMSAIAFGIPVQFDKAHVEGIARLEAVDIKYAEQLGYRIKLLGITKRAVVDGVEGIELRVHPTLIPTKRLIANVEGAMNAVLVQGDAIGATMYYGKGAGAEPTASAVIADLVDITRLATADPEHRVPHLAFQPNAMTDIKILPMAEITTSYYLRMHVADRPGVLADLTRILADGSISIDAMMQKEPAEGDTHTDIIMLTHQTQEKHVIAAIAKMEALASVVGKVTKIRLENLS
jgi:homoserine dehydrogenase